MGFITRAFSVLAGSEEFPTGTGETLRVQRSKVLLTKSVQCIISANQGWVLDVDRNPSDIDYTDIPPSSSSPLYDPSFPGLFLRNTISGCKMFISFFSGQYGGIKDFDGKSIVTIQNGDTHNGLIISIIPEDSDSEFGDPFSDKFLPDDATRLYGTAPYQTTIDAAYDPNSGWVYEYYFGVTPFCIFVYASHNESGTIETPLLAVPVYACGRILERVAHDETTVNSKYGVLPFRVYDSSYESWCYVFTQVIRDFKGNEVEVPGMTDTSLNSPFGFGDSGCSVSKYDGSWISGSDGNNYKVISYTINPFPLMFYHSDDSTQWSAIGISVNAYDLNEYGIVPGDGFKGILDTSLFRAIAGGTKGKIYDNGKFYCPEDKVGWLLGWDPSNDSAI